MQNELREEFVEYTYNCPVRGTVTEKVKKIVLKPVQKKIPSKWIESESSLLGDFLDECKKSFVLESKLFDGNP